MPCVHLYLAEGFEEIEMICVADILRRAQIETLLVSLTEEMTVCGAHGIKVLADRPFSATTMLADAIVLPGGMPGSHNLRNHEGLLERLRAHQQAGKHIAAICAAPTALAKAGVLKNHQACCFPGCEKALEEGGAIISAFNVITDGQITTSRGVGTATHFALELVRIFAGEDQARALGRAMLVI